MVHEGIDRQHNNFKAMDAKKDTHVKECCHTVNKYFGSIYSQLLPGAMAKVEMVERTDKKGKFLGYGCDIEVGFNGVIKNSLELSGGQRSLLALSFLMAMLRYKSAPFYILDEIDAALDLSHTENLGSIISNTFPNSQFIIISLKEGLYGCANILFKTSLIDGHSKVTRIIQKDARA